MLDPIFIGCSWLRSPKSFPRGSRPFFHCGGGSVERAVAHCFLIQRLRSPSRRLRRVVVERLVRIFIMAVRLFHRSLVRAVSALLPHHPPASLGIIIFSANVSVHRRRLVRRTVERLVGIYVLAVHALDLSEIVAPASMLFAGGWWRVHFTCGSPYILIPTSAFTDGALCAVRWNDLLGFMFWLFMPWTCPKSWPRGRCSLREGGGGSISRAVAHIF